MSAGWSEQFEARFSVRSSPELRSWLDDELWRAQGAGEFSRALAPAELFAPEPGMLWSGFMLPDTIPWVGNDYGDWLCLRVDERDEVREIVQWSHGGGDWIPVGDGLAESLLCDLARGGLSVGGMEEPSRSPPTAASPRWEEWARERLRQDREIELREGAAGQDAGALAPFAAAGLCRCLVVRERLLSRLDSPLKRRGDRPFARRCGVPWEPDFVRWLFDLDLVPESQRSELRRQWNAADDPLRGQDWEAAARIAAEVVAERSDLAWPFDVMGWSAEKRGARQQAIEAYARGVRASVFTDETIRLRTHWFGEQYGKFAAARLAELRAAASEEIAHDPYLRLYLSAAGDSLRERVTAYWLEAAAAARRRGDPAAEYDAYYRAGWDLGLRNLDRLSAILAGLAEAARAAGWRGRAAVAEMYRDALA